MTKQDLSRYSGLRFYNLSRRPGGKFRDIDCLTIYEVTQRGTCRYCSEVIGCVANKREYSYMMFITGGLYHVGRPSAENLDVEFLDKVKILQDRG